MAERLWPSQERLEPGVWIHGVSVGEAELAATFGQILKQKLPLVSVTLTASTPAGLGLLRRKFPVSEGNPAVRAFPLDLPFSVRRSFTSISPRLLVLMETELWPAALNEARRRQVPVEIVNARLSERSLTRLRRARLVFEGPLRALSHVAARTAADAERFLSLGLPASRVTVCGDLKYDRVLPRGSALAASVANLAAGRPVFAAGSLAPEEIAPVLDLFQNLSARPEAPRPLLLIAPRRPESFEDAARELVGRGLPHLRRSLWRGEAPAGEISAILLDTIGELAGSYEAATVAILGGTFAPKGGHNILEPLHYGVPVVHGPSITNIRQTVGDAEGAVFAVGSVPGALPIVEKLLLDAEIRNRASEAARALFARNRGAGEKAAAIALRLLEGGREA